MANTTKKTDMIKIYSNEKSVSHQPRTGELYWLWEKNPSEKECYIEKTREEVARELRQSKGFRRMVDSGILFVKDEAIVEEFNLSCLDGYIKSIDELTKFIDTCTVAEFEDYCQYAPESMIENIAVICTEHELTDTRKIRIYEEYTGKDLLAFYKDNAEVMDNIEVKSQEKKPARKKKVIKE